MMDASSNQKAVAAALINALIIGLSFIFVKIALSVSDPLDTLAHRFTLSFLAASLFAFPGRARLKAAMPRAAKLLPLALLYPSLFFALQAFGLLYAPSSVAGIVQAVVPVFTMILAAIFLKEHTTLAQKMFTLVSVAGVVLIFAVPGVSISSASLGGILLILLSALSMAGYNAGARRMTKTWSPKEMTYIITFFGFLFFNAVSVIKHISAGTLSQYFVPLQEPKFLMAMLYLGVLSSLITSLLTNYALSRMEASRVSVFGSLSTVVTIAGGVLLLNERLDWYHWVGAVLIIGGVMGVNLKRRPSVQADQSKQIGGSNG
ncbi:DMT family transporter [Paenibacillus sp. XY044]|uniref:DMT family transporter n=1 Tax=Paenibacillus sp. XY044 TaxID=2026089 RepID=UPI000B98BA89|nr:DMT family transporter [Paenibacillus sp. XY044]OZB90430.1 EamA family transporter [Paenibacillus sp. XY044]